MIVIVIGLLVTIVTCIPVFAQMRRHPKGLHILFFAEMWERFSYYGMRGLLIFYLTQHFIFDDRFAQGLYGTYAALVYLLPLVGGFLADKYLGTHKAIAFGALLLVAGHFMMGVEGPPARQMLNVSGSTYEFVVEGRANDRQVFLQVGEGRHNFSATPEGGLRIEDLPAGAPLPDELEPGEYEMTVEGRQPFFVGVFYLAIALIVMGVGYLKANISSAVGQLYAQGDPRRDPGFTLYYFGINLGAFWAGILCGWLGQSFGWAFGFGAAGVGMLLGWAVFVSRRLLFFIPGPPQLPLHIGAPPDPEALKKPLLGPITLETALYLLAVPCVALVWFVSQRHETTGWMLTIGGLLFLGYFIFYVVTKCTAVEAQRLILSLILIIASIMFWALFEQAGSSLNLFAERNTQLPNDGFVTVQAAQVQSFNPFFILVFAPIFAGVWVLLGRMGKDPNTPLKFALALVQVGLGFWLLVWGANFADENYRVPLIFLAGAYLLHTTGELCLSPVGLSMITKLSPAAIVSFMMAGWFLSSAFAHYAAGIIAQFTAVETAAGQVLDPAGALATYTAVFWEIGLWAIVMGIALGAASFFLKRLAHESELGDADATPHAQPDPALPRPARPVEGDV